MVYLQMEEKVICNEKSKKITINDNSEKNLFNKKIKNIKLGNYFHNALNPIFSKSKIMISFLFLILFFIETTFSKLIDKSRSKYYLKKQLKTNTVDNASWSQADGAIQTKLDFEVYIDMKNKVIDGFVRFNYKCLKPTTNFIALDINNIKIKKVLNKEKKEVDFQIKKNTENSIGDALIIYSDEICKSSNKEIANYVDIFYSTLPNNMGIHFSNPNTLYDKRYTFLYTHGEAIYGRTFFPSQDTPSLKVKLSAKIIIDEPYTALFSGKLISKKSLKNENKTEFYFEMNDPIPTYLITFAAGNLVKKTIPNSRCEVYGEEESLKYVNESFKYCEEYIKFYETYRKFFLEKMVFLITPDDFPFAGMENPFATIITESVLSKDRSYTSTISHEIAHFWSGNLVTNKNWKSFWLNEGITTYLTRKSFRKIHGEDEFSFEMYMGLYKLENALEDLKKNSKFDASQRSLTPLIKDDPYKSFSRIPYEKGSFFMYYLETLLGEDVMNKILSDYFNEFAFKSLDSDQFIEFVKNKIKKYYNNKKENLTGEDIIKKVEWDEWLNGSENLPFKFNFQSKTLNNFKEKVELIKKGSLTPKELKDLLKPMRLIEKGRIYKELIEKFTNLNEKTKILIKEIIKVDDLFDSHKSTKADQILLRALFMDDAEERIDYLKKSLLEFPFYKVLHMKKVFGLINDKKSEKKFLTEVLNGIADRLNPVTIARITELIDTKAKKA